MYITKCSVVGEVTQVDIPDALLEELGELRIGYAMLLRNYEKQLRNSPELDTRGVY